MSFDGDDVVVRRRRRFTKRDAIAAAMVVLLGIAMSIPKPFWVAAGVVVGLGFLVRWARTVTRHRSRRASTRGASTEHNQDCSMEEDPELVQLTTDTPGTEPGEFAIPSPPRGSGRAKWIPPGCAVQIAGVTLPDGMVYVGTHLPTLNPYDSINDVCLIDPSEPVAARGDYRQIQHGRVPQYAVLSAQSRRAYLDWLADGRRHPDADLGFVRLFFFGIERRVLNNPDDTDELEADAPALVDELNGLIGAYGARSSEFRRAATTLLAWLTAIAPPPRLYEQPVETLQGEDPSQPPLLKIAIGQAASDGAPLSPSLALAWAQYMLDLPSQWLYQQYGQLFDRLFMEKYADRYPTGLAPVALGVPALALHYDPLSPTTAGASATCTVDGLPDLELEAVLNRQLRALATATEEALMPYIRYLFDRPGTESSLGAILRLPVSLWPDHILVGLDALKRRVGDGPLVVPFQEVLVAFGTSTAQTRGNVERLTVVLSSIDLGMDPDVRMGMPTPKPDTTVALFAAVADAEDGRCRDQYAIARLTVQLAAPLLDAAGDNAKTAALAAQVRAWPDLTQGLRARLQAQIHRFRAAPPGMVGVKKALEPLDTPTRTRIAKCLVTVAQAGSMATPAQIKILQKLYRTLGLPTETLFSDLHAGVSHTAQPAAGAAFELNTHRIAKLRQESRRASDFLSDIFQEEGEAPPTAGEQAKPSIDAETTAILGLDSAHSAFARAVLTRQTWDRDTLAATAAELGLMLDGALEHINEAAFDTLDMPFTEGDDPIEVNADIVENLSQ